MTPRDQHRIVTVSLVSMSLVVDTLDQLDGGGQDCIDVVARDARRLLFDLEARQRELERLVAAEGVRA
jgi:hypothetical protein